MRLDTFVNACLAPQALNEISDIQLDTLLRVLRASNLSSSFYAHAYQNLDKTKLDTKSVAYNFYKHLHSSYIFSKAQDRQVNHVSDIIQEQLNEIDCPFVFLKGAAYTLAKTKNAQGRVYSDIDILVPKAKLKEVEYHLSLNGWEAKEVDDYDDKYYREWSHELPPMVHRTSGASLDIHHTLLPPISGYIVDVEHLWQCVQPHDNHQCPSVDYMILHSSIHLLLNEDVEKGLRDLFDIHFLIDTYIEEHPLHALYETFSRSGFEQEFNLLIKILNQVFEPAYLTQLDPTKFDLQSNLTSRLYVKACCANIDKLDIRFKKLANTMVFLRGHFKKMPIHIFTRHVIYKTLRGINKKLFGEFIYRA